MGTLRSSSGLSGQREAALLGDMLDHCRIHRRSLLACLCLPVAAIFAAEAPPAALNHAPGTDLLVEGNALPRLWLAPVLPSGIELKDRAQLIVILRCVIDQTGKVTSARILHSPNPQLDAAALAAFKSWQFSPAIHQNKPVTSCLDLPMVFTGATTKRHDLLPPRQELFQEPPLEEAKVTYEPDADYPSNLVERGLPGRVMLAWVVTTEGRVSEPRVLNATHVDFVLPALAALARWKFIPARRGDLVVASEIPGAIDFEQPALSRGELLKANDVTAPDGSAPDPAPELISAPDPVWPYDALLQGESGEATAEFTVGENGHVRDVKVRSASRPEFGASLVAAVANWRFKPALGQGSAVAVPLLKHASFAAEPADGPAGDPWGALVRAARAHTISDAPLDAPLQPIFRVSPLYPPGLRAAGGREGSTVLELVVARDGRVRLVRIVSASQDEFGWAAATAFSQWLFARPQRGAQPVDVRVEVPVHFPAVGN